MIEIGKKQKLIVAKTVDFGVYLAAVSYTHLTLPTKA